MKRATYPFAIQAVLIALSLLTVSCSSWQRTVALSDPAAREKHYARLRVEPVDGGAFELRDPWFGGDTLYGRSARGDTVSIPVDRISKLEARRYSGSKTFLCVVGVGLTVAVVAAAVAASDYHPTGSRGDGSTSGGPDFSSCPLIDSWDGEAWRLDSTTFAGALMPALTRTDVDNLDHPLARDGIVSLRLRGETGETEHVDALRLLAVDHHPQDTVAPDATGALHSLGRLGEPIAAHDFKGGSVLPLVRANDARNWESVPTGRDTARAEDLRDGVEVEFPKAAGATEARLVVDGRYTAWAEYLLGQYIQLHGRDTGAWYTALGADKTRARGFAAAIAREAFLDVSVWDGTRWSHQGFLPGAGPGIPKRQVVRLDLSQVRGERVRVRLEAAPSFWLIDRIAIDFEPERGFVTKEIALIGATDSQGRDARVPLDRADGQDVVLEGGDTVELRFAVDPVPSGRARSYLAATTGWYHIHTPESGDPDWALAERLIQEPRAMSRISVARLNDALHSMEAAR